MQVHQFKVKIIGVNVIFSIFVMNSVESRIFYIFYLSNYSIHQSIIFIYLFIYFFDNLLIHESLHFQCNV